MVWDGYLANSDVYDYAVFSIPNGTTDYDLKTNIAALWRNLSVAKGIVIKLDQTVSIKLNSTSNPAIPCTTAQAPFEFLNKILLRNAYISNSSGSTVNIEVLLI